ERAVAGGEGRYDTGVRLRGHGKENKLHGPSSIDVRPLCAMSTCQRSREAEGGTACREVSKVSWPRLGGDRQSVYTDIGTYQYYDKGEPAAFSFIPIFSGETMLSLQILSFGGLLKCGLISEWREDMGGEGGRGGGGGGGERESRGAESVVLLQVMLSSGVLVTFTLNGPQLEQVCVDRTLVGRLPANTVTDAVLSDRLIVLSFLEQSQVAAVYLNQKNQGSPETGRRTDKLSPSEIKVRWSALMGCGVCGREWAGSEAPQTGGWVSTASRMWRFAGGTWKSPARSRGPGVPRPCTGPTWCCSAAHRLKASRGFGAAAMVLSSVRTEGNPLDCRFSLLQPYQLLTVELPSGPQGSREGSWADACVYECARERLHRLSVTRIPLPSHPVSCSRHPSEATLLLGLSDSSLVLYDQRRGVSLLASCPVPPTLLAWHPAGAVVMVGGGQGELVCFDVGLAPIGIALVAEEVASAATLRLAQHLRCNGGLEGLKWGTSLEGGPEGTDILMLAFHGGPLAALRLKLGALTGGQIGAVELLQQRLRCGQVREALGILEAMDWGILGDECYRGLSSVTNHLLRLELNAEREAQLEAALGVFYAPPAPLSDMVILEYREPISKYARRFFHHLLRHQRFEKAFLLAVDLEARDLFMDLHYVASDKGEVVLADVAKRKANEIEAQSIAGSDDPLRGRNGVLCGSSLGDQQMERNQSAPGPSYPETPTTHADGRSTQRRPLQAESVHVTVSPDVLRILRQTDTNRNRSCKKRSGSVPVHLLDKCEQNVNSFQSTHIQTPERARGQKVDSSLTTGDVAQSIVLLNRVRRLWTLGAERGLEGGKTKSAC
ncbi:hypothetical protein L3Q82_012045, partial [Scortum barcoo]